MAATPTTNLFSLPLEVRNDIYQRVLDLGRPLYLFQEEEEEDVFGKVGLFYSDPPVQWLSLLYTNWQLHDEASAELYKLTRFNLVLDGGENNLLPSFLACIGSFNAAHLSHIVIGFPSAEMEKSPEDKMVLKAVDLSVLKLLAEKCLKLATLEMDLSGTAAEWLAHSSDKDLQAVREALLQVDAQLRAIPSLNKILIGVDDEHPAFEATVLMQQFGWLIVQHENTLPGRCDEFSDDGQYEFSDDGQSEFSDDGQSEFSDDG
jgi:hypothetical protein